MVRSKIIPSHQNSLLSKADQYSRKTLFSKQRGKRANSALHQFTVKKILYLTKYSIILILKCKNSFLKVPFSQTFFFLSFSGSIQSFPFFPSRNNQLQDKVNHHFSSTKISPFFIISLSDNIHPTCFTDQNVSRTICTYYDF